jgi:hypothetical protein
VGRGREENRSEIGRGEIKRDRKSLEQDDEGVEGNDNTSLDTKSRDNASKGTRNPGNRSPEAEERWKMNNENDRPKKSRKHKIHKKKRGAEEEESTPNEIRNCTITTTITENTVRTQRKSNRRR